MNNVVLSGRLTKDVECRTAPNGTTIARFTVAVDRKFDREKTDFINCTAFKNTAEFVNKYFKKGSYILLNGSLQVSSWDSPDGKKNYSTSVVVDNVEFGGAKANAAPNNTNQYPTAPNNAVPTDFFEPLDYNEADLPY